MTESTRPDPDEELWEEEHPKLPFEDPAIDREEESDEGNPRS